jgi:hypothetical protein
MDSNSSSLFSLNIDPVTKTHLSETAKWARFLAIFGMVVLALALFAALMSTTILTTFSYPVRDMEVGNQSMTNMAKVSMVVGMVIAIAVVFFPLLFLLRFSNSLRSAIRANDQNKLNIAFQNLKIYFRYLGIVTIIFVVFYGLIIGIALVSVSGR